jgi:hypothetical protein
MIWRGTLVQYGLHALYYYILSVMAICWWRCRGVDLDSIFCYTFVNQFIVSILAASLYINY